MKHHLLLYKKNFFIGVGFNGTFKAPTFSKIFMSLTIICDSQVSFMKEMQHRNVFVARICVFSYT